MSDPRLVRVRIWLESAMAFVAFVVVIVMLAGGLRDKYLPPAESSSKPDEAAAFCSYLQARGTECTRASIVASQNVDSYLVRVVSGIGTKTYVISVDSKTRAVLSAIER